MLGRNILSKCFIQRIARLKGICPGLGISKTLDREWWELGIVGARHANRLVAECKDFHPKRLQIMLNGKKALSTFPRNLVSAITFFAMTDVHTHVASKQGHRKGTS